MLKFKKSKKNKEKKKRDFWFNPKKIRENFKTIHWLPLVKTKDGSECLLAKYGKIVFFMAFIALIFVAIDAGVSSLMSVAGLFS